MYSVSETIEFELFLVTASPSIWIVGDILYWPPEGSSINRSILVPPGPDWIPYKCKVLKSNIGKKLIQNFTSKFERKKFKSWFCHCKNSVHIEFCYSYCSYIIHWLWNLCLIVPPINDNLIQILHNGRPSPSGRSFVRIKICNHGRTALYIAAIRNN